MIRVVLVANAELSVVSFQKSRLSSYYSNASTTRLVPGVKAAVLVSMAIQWLAVHTSVDLALVSDLPAG